MGNGNGLGTKFWLPIFITSMLAVGGISVAAVGVRQNYRVDAIVTTLEKHDEQIHTMGRAVSALQADVRNVKSTLNRVEDKIDQILIGGSP